MKQFLNFRMLCAAVLAAFMLASCADKESDLLSMVPKDTKGVLVVKPLDLAKKADLQNLTLKNVNQEMFNQINSFFNGDMGVDPKEVVVFEYEKEVWALFNVADESKLVAEFGGEKVASSGDGTTVYAHRGNQISVNGGLGLFSSLSSWSEKEAERNNGKIIDMMHRLMNLKEKQSVVSIPKFTSNMSGKDAHMYLNIGEICDMVEKEGSRADRRALEQMKQMPMYNEIFGANAYFSINFEKNDIIFNSVVLDKDGKNINGKFNFKNLDKGLLKFFDEKATAVTAFSIPEEYIGFMADMIANEVNDIMMGNVIKTGINSLEGNMALGGTLKNINDWYTNDYTAVIKLKKDFIPTFKTLLNQKMGESGIYPDSKGNYSIHADDGLTLKIGFKDEYLYVSNADAPSKSFASSSNAGKFSGKTGVIYVDMPKGSLIASMATMATGADLSGYFYAWSDDKKSEAVLHIDNNPESNILKLIIKTIDGMYR